VAKKKATLGRKLGRGISMGGGNRRRGKSGPPDGILIRKKTVERRPFRGVRAQQKKNLIREKPRTFRPQSERASNHGGKKRLPRGKSSSALCAAKGPAMEKFGSRRQLLATFIRRVVGGKKEKATSRRWN